MKSFSERTLRRAESGYVMLETVIAILCVGLVLGTTLGISADMIQRRVDIIRQFELTAMARALTDEYIATYPRMSHSGNYKGKWNWEINETLVEPETASAFDPHFRFFELSIAVRQVQSPHASNAFHTIVVRGKP